MTGRPAATWRPRLGCAVVALAVVAAPAAAQTADVERFGGRLSRMPVDLVTTSTIRGEGVVSAELRGPELTLRAELLPPLPGRPRGGAQWLAEQGALTGLSVEFNPLETTTDDDGNTVILRAELVGLGLVDSPAYP